jgi:hypothetical protein
MLWPASCIQLTLEFIEKLPVCSVHDPLGRRVDHPRFMQPERIKAERVLGVIVAQAPVLDVGQRLERVVLAGEAHIGQPLCNPLRFGSTIVCCFEERAKIALGGDRMLLHKIPTALERAAEILRPGPILNGADDHSTHLAGSELLGFRREGEKGVGLLLDCRREAAKVANLKE